VDSEQFNRELEAAEEKSYWDRKARWLLIFWAIAAWAVMGWRVYTKLPRPMIQLTIAAQFGVFLIALARSERFRNWLCTLDVPALTLFQYWRLAPGWAFLWFHTHRAYFPTGFSNPAGYGDIAVAITALPAAYLAYKGWRRTVLGWHILAMSDLFMVISLAARFGMRDPQTMSPFAEYPFAMLPLMLVPLSLMAHSAAILQLLRKPHE